jgi:hypothetical protein
MFTRPMMRTALLTATLAAFGAGCGDGSGPDDGRFDPARLMADGQALEQVLSLGIFQSVGVAAATASPGEGGVALLAADALLRGARRSVSDGADAGRRAASTIARSLLDLAPELTAAPVLPSSVLGTTYVYDAPTQRYAPAPGRTGAPSNGVRFILYAIDPITHQPVVGAEVGYADLIDRGGSTLGRIELQLVVVSGGQTYLDYTLEITGGQSSGELAVDGYLTDGTTRVDFDIGVRGSSGALTSEAEIDFELAIRSRDFSVEGHAEAIGGVATGEADIELVVRSGGDRIRYDVTGSSTTIDANVYVNDRLLAIISGDPRSPTVTGANGQALTSEEAEALIYLIHLADAVFAVVGELLVAPIAFIAYLAAIP